MCTICLDTLILTKERTILSCGHEFHNECFDNWSGQFKNDYVDCPLCRRTTRKKYPYTNPPDFVIIYPQNNCSKLWFSAAVITAGVTITITIVQVLYLKVLDDS